MVRHQEVNVNASGNLDAKQTQFGGGKARESKGWAGRGCASITQGHGLRVAQMPVRG